MSGLRFGLNLSMQRRERLWPPCTHGPDGGLPVQESLWYRGQGWCDGSLYASVSAYLTAASGTFSRGSDGTRFDASGIMQTDGPNVLRLDHDPETGEALGLRAEGQRANIIVQNTSLDVWSKYGNPVSSNVAIAPDGTLTGDRLSGLTDNYGVYRSSLTVTKPVQSPSFFAKNVDNLTSKILCQQAAAPLYGTWHIDLRTVDGWKRIVKISPYILATKEFIPYAGKSGIYFLKDDIDNASMYIWGVQLEDAPFSSSMIYTGASIATRLSDSLSYAIAGTSEGTVVVSARTPLGADDNQTLWCWDGGTADNRYRLVRDSSRHLRFVVTVSGTDVINVDLGTVADDTGLKVAASWKSGQFAASLNGAAAVTDSSYAGSLPSVTTMREGSSSNGSEWFGTIKRMRRYSTAYSAAQLPGMSA